MQLPPIFARDARSTPVEAASAAVRRREDAPDAKFVAAEHVCFFALVAGVAEERSDFVPGVCGSDEHRELGRVGLRAAVNDCADDDVRADVAGG